MSEETSSGALYNSKEYMDAQFGGIGENNKYIIKWFPKGGKLLNVGCGPFREADLLKTCGLQLYAVDISKVAIDIAGKKCVDAKVCDARVRIPYPDNFFDVTYSAELLEHLGQVMDFFNELYRVTKTGGVLIITCPLLGWWKYRLRILLGKDIFDDHHCRFFTIDSIKKNLESAGFKLTDYEVSGRLRYIKKSLCGHIFLRAEKPKAETLTSSSE
jgi:SAM-dependent methyltransferase